MKKKDNQMVIFLVLNYYLLVNLFTTFATLEASTDSKALNTSIGIAKIIVLD